jgi:hypothetical protein
MARFEVFELSNFQRSAFWVSSALWSALHVAERASTRLDGVEFTGLVGSAESQYAAVEKRRISCAETALKPVKTITKT